MTYFNRVFEHIIKPKFFFDTAESIARRHVSLYIRKSGLQIRLICGMKLMIHLKVKLRLWIRCRMGSHRINEFLLLNTILKNQQRNHENRKKQTIPHIRGSKANATRRAKMMVETGQWPGRAQMYIATHKNQDGVYVNKVAKEICEKIESALSQSTTDES
ncbi:hypothetical protein P3L10_033430 [Capsicum annuum]